MADKSKEKAKEKDKPKGHDWDALKMKFVTCPFPRTLAEFFTDENIPVGTGYNHASEENWREERTKYRIALNNRVKAIIAEHDAMTTEDFLSMLDAEITRQICGLQEAGEISMDNLDTVIKLRLLLAGKPTEHTKNEFSGLDGAEDEEVEELLGAARREIATRSGAESNN